MYVASVTGAIVAVRAMAIAIVEPRDKVSLVIDMSTCIPLDAYRYYT